MLEDPGFNPQAGPEVRGEQWSSLGVGAWQVHSLSGL